VTLVILTASTVSRLLLGGSGPTSSISPTGPFDVPRFAETIAFAVIAGVIGRRTRIPGGQFLVPLIVAAGLHAAGLLQPYVPWWLLAAAYTVIGWSVGLLYTRETLRAAVRVLPVLALSTAVLIALCAGSGMLLSALAHVDPMTAYLATTPGGLDSVAVIALGAGSNLPLILAAQTMRVFAVIGTGPSLAKLIARIA
jgi:membrane AbrB-like protein